MYSEIQAEQDGSAFLTEEQQLWTATMERLLAFKPRRFHVPPTDSCRAWCYHLIHRPHFDTAVLCVILFNSALMASDGYGTPNRYAAALSSLNDLCTLAFIAEAAVKISGLGWDQYIDDGWHRFDLTVIGFAVLDWLASLLFGAWGEKQPALVRVLRLTRVLRTLRLTRLARGLLMLLSMFAVSMVGLLNVLGVYLVVLCTYSLLAMQLFGEVAYGSYINEDANFCKFPSAMLTLFRCATGEQWNELMRDAMPRHVTLFEEHGGAGDAGGGGVGSDCSVEGALGGMVGGAAAGCALSGAWVALPFFITYEVLSRMMILKMEIAFINENFSAALLRGQASVSATEADEFVRAWSRFDKDATGKVRVKDLTPLLLELKPPLGLDPRRHGEMGMITASRVSHYLLQMSITVHRGDPTNPAEPQAYVRFPEVLATLTKDMIGDRRGSAKSAPSARGERGMVASSVPSVSFSKRCSSDGSYGSSSSSLGVGSFKGGGGGSFKGGTEVRKAEQWSTVLPDADTMLGQRWQRTLKEEYAIPVDTYLMEEGGDGESDEESPASHRLSSMQAHMAQTRVANAWRQKAAEMRLARASIEAALRTLRPHQHSTLQQGDEMLRQARLSLLPRRPSPPVGAIDHPPTGNGNSPPPVNGHSPPPPASPHRCTRWFAPDGSPCIAEGGAELGTATATLSQVGVREVAMVDASCQTPRVPTTLTPHLPPPRSSPPLSPPPRSSLPRLPPPRSPSPRSSSPRSRLPRSRSPCPPLSPQTAVQSRPEATGRRGGAESITPRRAHRAHGQELDGRSGHPRSLERSPRPPKSSDIPRRRTPASAPSVAVLL